MNVENNKIYGLLGRNGAGKTTTMRMLLNLVHVTSGQIYLFGKDYRRNQQELYKRIGSIIETPGFYENLTGADNLQILTRLRGQHDKSSIKNALELVGLEHETKKKFGDYSLGMKQRLGIAASLMHDPELLILDEPINGLDPIGIYQIRNILLTLCKEKGVTILISSHLLSEVEQLADVIGVMHQGKLIEEVDMKVLHKRCRQYIEFQVSDENRACLLLEKRYGVTDYSVHDGGKIYIYNDFNMRDQYNKTFVENGISVYRINMEEERLEDYFSKLIGGGQIG